MDQVSLNSKSNTSLTLDSASYPKDLDPFGEDDDEGETSKPPPRPPPVKTSVIVEPAYPVTFDPFADDEATEKNGVKSNPTRKSRISMDSHEKNVTSPDKNGVNLDTPSKSRPSDYDESLDPFGGDEDNSSLDYRKSVGPSRETQKPAIVVAGDNESIQSEFESGDMVKRSSGDRDSYINQNSPVPVPPRRKHRNVSPSSKSLNRASYSASSLEREPKNEISSPISQNPNRLSTAETDTYLSHSISNLSTRSTSPVNTVRSSPIRSRKKRRAPEPPGFPPSGSVASPLSPNTSLVIDNSIDSTHETANESIIESTIESTNDSINESKNKSINETFPPIPDNEHSCEEISRKTPETEAIFKAENEAEAEDGDGDGNEQAAEHEAEHGAEDETKHEVEHEIELEDEPSSEPSKQILESNDSSLENITGKTEHNNEPHVKPGTTEQSQEDNVVISPESNEEESLESESCKQSCELKTEKTLDSNIESVKVTTENLTEEPSKDTDTNKSNPDSIKTNPDSQPDASKSS